MKTSAFPRRALVVCLLLLGAAVPVNAGIIMDFDSGLARAVKEAEDQKKEKEADAKKKRELADAEAKKRAEEEAIRLANINEAGKLRAAAQQLLKEVTEEKNKVAKTQEALSRAEAALKESQANHKAETEALEKEKYKLEVREIAFSTSLVMAVLTILFGIYQHVTSRQNRRLQEQKTQAEIDKIQAETEILRRTPVAPPAA